MGDSPCSRTLPVEYPRSDVLNQRNSIEAHRWQSVTQETIRPPERVDVRRIGRRRELLMQYYKLTAPIDESEQEIEPQPHEKVSDVTEYGINYSNNEFVPFMENNAFFQQKTSKYPLYGGPMKTSYHETTLKGRLRSASHPFRRTAQFTTPLELAIREPPPDGF